MRILAFDPSSTAIGYAMADTDTKTAVFRQYGKHEPSKNREPWVRICEIAGFASGLISHNGADDLVVVIETSSGKVNPGRHGGGGAGLAMYGQAVGAVVGMAWAQMPAEKIYLPTERWTGSHSKDKRKRVAKGLAPFYDPQDDKGGDVADALCLAHWFWITNVRGK